MKMSEIKELTAEEKINKLDELHQESFELKIKSKTGQLENPARITQIRKDIARIKTDISAQSKAAN